jgi:hypothetical protein
MERPKSLYSIHPRPTTKKNRWVYYAQFRDEGGGYSTVVSTGYKRRDDAVRWCEVHIQKSRESQEKRTELISIFPPSLRLCTCG